MPIQLLHCRFPVPSSVYSVVWNFVVRSAGHQRSPCSWCAFALDCLCHPQRCQSPSCCRVDNNSVPVEREPVVVVSHDRACEAGSRPCRRCWPCRSGGVSTSSCPVWMMVCYVPLRAFITACMSFLPHSIPVPALGNLRLSAFVGDLPVLRSVVSRCIGGVCAVGRDVQSCVVNGRSSNAHRRLNASPVLCNKLQHYTCTVE